jgi:hypothetical protein
MLNDKLARVFASANKNNKNKKIISRVFTPYNVITSNASEKSKG